MIHPRALVAMLALLPTTVQADAVDPHSVQDWVPWQDQPIDVPELGPFDGPALEDQEAIKREVGLALLAYENSLHFCRGETALDIAPAGSWTIGFFIEQSGRTSGVVVNGEARPTVATDECIQATVLAWRFPLLAAPQKLERTWSFGARPVAGSPLPTAQATQLVQDAIYDSRKAKRCFVDYQQATGKLPKLATLRFTLQVDGTPTEVSLDERKLQKSELSGCLEDMLGSLTLPELQEGPQVFVFPFEF